MPGAIPLPPGLCGPLCRRPLPGLTFGEVLLSGPGAAPCPPSLLPTVPGPAAAGVAANMAPPPQSKPHAITQLIAAAPIGERFTTFLELAVHVGAASDGWGSLWHIRRS
ncbi:hypothetical protein MAIC_01740 [Mycolicibacterium aichiense]|uniref:Uncharacterized protein n=1 Tax=Mycolicibacterium aichiense TaxID=1799 RepID=A0AAD1MA75_9MYCO|nr:hypothetical protein MAIC_01740 [Mycolicibacterium aichiense]